MAEIETDAVIGAVIGGVIGLLCTCLCVRTWHRKRQQRYNFGLDPDERRFKRRLEQQSRALDGVFAIDIDEDLELSAKEIEQLQALEQELARRASGTPAREAVTEESKGAAAVRVPTKLDAAPEDALDAALDAVTADSAEDDTRQLNGPIQASVTSESSPGSKLKHKKQKQ